jgi:hypothetical protein
MYQKGSEFAQEVQEGLRNGKSFDDMEAYPPDRAAHIRDISKEPGVDPIFYEFWDGYVSRWD